MCITSKAKQKLKNGKNENNARIKVLVREVLREVSEAISIFSTIGFLNLNCLKDKS